MNRKGTLWPCVGSSLLRRAVLMVIGGYVCVSCGCQNHAGGGAFVPAYPIHHERPAWGPDGRIAYRDNGVVWVNADGTFEVDADSAGIWVTNESGRARRQMSVFGDNPFWRPSDGALCFWHMGMLYYIDSDESTRVLIRREQSGAVASWWPDGASLAIADAVSTEDKYRLCRYWPDMNVLQVLVADDGVPCLEPSVASSGECIMYRKVYGYPVDELHVLHVASGSDDRLDIPVAVRGGGVWSPGGREYAFTGSGPDGRTAIYVGHFGGDAVARLSQASGKDPSWSVDGRAIVYCVAESGGHAEESGVLWVVDVASGIERQLTRWRE